MNKIQRYEELNDLIFRLNTKRNQTPKDLEKLEKLHNEQHELFKDSEVQEYVYSNIKN